VKINIYENELEMSQKTAAEIIRLVNEKPDALLCFAAGNTPIGTFKELVQAVREKQVSFEECHFVGLDEWVGLNEKDAGSCRHMVATHFFEPAGITRNQVHFFDACADSLKEECKKIDQFIFSHGSIDLILLGLGVNAHLGFNEPGVSFELFSHVIDLAPETIEKGKKKYFKQQKTLNKGITLGPQHILNAKRAILIADGESKAIAVYHMAKEQVSTKVPATILQKHENCMVNLDQEAGKRL